MLHSARPHIASAAPTGAFEVGLHGARTASADRPRLNAGAPAPIP